MDSARAAVRPMIARPDARGLREIGRQARLELTFAVRDGCTVLAHAYSEPPFRVGRCLRDADSLHLILASSAPGIFGGDSLRQTITVERGARVRLTSQSAMQVHAAMDGSVATIASSYRVESGGHLDCEWDPLIPFPNARLEQHIEIDLDPAAVLRWSDAWMSGREGRGERWQFAELSHELLLSRGGRLAYAERYCIEPSAARPSRSWVADDACYFGTMLAAGPAADKTAAASLYEQLAMHSGVRAAADCLDENLLLIRLMACSGLSFHDARAVAGNALKT